MKNVDTDAAAQLTNLETGRGAKHTPFAAEATAAQRHDAARSNGNLLD